MSEVFCMRTAKYGRKMRNLADAADSKRKARYECPKCGKKSVQRKAYALWKCRSCGAEIAGGAYSLRTASGETARRLIAETKGE